VAIARFAVARAAVRVLRTILLLVALAVCGVADSVCQELEPRSYAPAPVGANFVGVAYAYSTGDIVFDAALPVDDVTARVHGILLAYGRTFGVFGRQATASGALPYAFGDVAGTVYEQAKKVERSGLADFRGRIAVNLYGTPALALKDFAQRRRTPFILGTSLTVSAPVGEYYGDKLINLGTNRWAFKPELGVSVPWRKLDFDTYCGVWFFTNNTDFFPAQKTRRQDPLSAVQGHVTYTFRPTLWFAVDGTWYGGGASTVDGGPPSARVDNSRYGGTLSLPVTKSQSLKLAYSRGAIVRAGSDFSVYLAAWQLRWF